MIWTSKKVKGDINNEYKSQIRNWIIINECDGPQFIYKEDNN